MQFIRLEFAALGPYPGKHVIDFAALSEQGLFLLEGPTGSGKSSIIDAIVFALYGNVAGEGSDKARIRSTYADSNTSTYVDLVFAVSSGTYRIRRSPRWERAKKRGTGTTVTNEKAALWRLSETAVDEERWDDGEPIASRPSDVGKEMAPILGLNREQFVKTVVLPQGQFAQFLQLKSEQRSALLETLFDTTSFRAFADELAAQAKGEQAAIETAREASVNAFHAWLGIDGLPESELPEIGEDSFFSGVQAVHALLVDAEAKARDNAARQRRILDEAAVQADAARQTAQLLKERSELLAELEQLQGQQEAIDKAKRTLALDERAKLPADRLTDVDAALSQLAVMGTDFESVQGVAAYADALDLIQADLGDLAMSGTGSQAASSAEDGPGETSSALARLREHNQALDKSASALAKSLSVRIGELAPLAMLEAELPERRKAHAESIERIESMGGEITQLVEANSKVPEQVAAWEQTISKAREAAKSLSGLQAALAASEELLVRGKEAAAVKTRLDSAKNDVARKLELRQEADREDASVTTNWIQSAAADLALRLKDGGPCPVCGSTDHPSPASPSDSHATFEDVQAARAALNKANEDLEAARLSAERLALEYSSHEKQLGGKSAAELEAELQEAKAAVAAATTESEQEGTATKELDNLRKTVHERELKVAHLESELQATRENSAALLKQIEADDSRLQQARGEYDTVASFKAHLESELSGTEKALEASRALARALTRVTDAQQAAKQALDAASMSARDARAAVLGSQKRTELQEGIKQHAARWEAVTSQLEKPTLKALTGQENPDVEGLSAAKSKAEAEWTEAQRQATLALQRVNDSSRLTSQLNKRLEEWNQLTLDAGPIMRLAALANADSQSLISMKLNVWVLTQRFDQIVERANEHLNNFSFGQYELRRSAQSGGERKTGLGLEVIHHDLASKSDHTRSPATLSGGETFYTSLALALALSEVVQEENGGLRMDTLIIDEGFGTLSADYLQTVMDTLASLRSSGRTVGIISHVEELKAMIPDRVSVSKLPTGGSTLRIT